MRNAPKVSVIIPTYNRAALLTRAVESVLQQTYGDLEVLIVDDGSVDETPGFIERLMRQYSGEDGPIRCFFQENHGKSTALNHGLANARGEWIAFLDSDDQWLPTKLEEQFCTLGQFRHCGACFTDARYVNNSQFPATALQRAGERYPNQKGVVVQPTTLLDGPQGIYTQTLLVHSGVMKRVGKFDAALRVMEDWDIIVRISVETSLCYVNKPLVVIDRTPNRAEGLIELLVAREDRDLDAQQRMYERWLCLSTHLGERAEEAVRSRLRTFHSRRANLLLQRSRYWDAVREMAEAVRTKVTVGSVVKCVLTATAPPIARHIFRNRVDDGIEHDIAMAMKCCKR